MNLILPDTYQQRIKAMCAEFDAFKSSIESAQTPEDRRELVSQRDLVAYSMAGTLQALVDEMEVQASVRSEAA